MTGAEPREVRILVVEDEEHLAAGIAENLEDEGYRAEVVGHGGRAVGRILEGAFDLVILDVMLPEKDGFTVCQEVRSQGSKIPILFLTARGDLEDRLRGLETGGDDYLPKPFHLEELLLRVKVILRRWRWYEGDGAGRDGQVPSLRFGGNEFDPRSFTARAWDGSRHELTHKEALILEVLAERAGEVISREDLLERVWGYELLPSTRTIDNFILRLRKRFEPDPEAPRFFHTVRGVGYRFTPEGET